MQPETESATVTVQRWRVLAAVAGYLALVAIAWWTGNDSLSAICVVLLVSAVLGSRLRTGSRGAWLIWMLVVAGVATLAFNGQGRIALDLVPLAINIGLAALFGLSLTGTHTPFIARAIIAIDGRDRLDQPRVAGYARALTLAWALLFAVQSVAFVLLMFVWMPRLPGDSRAHAWATTWLHVGGYLLPAVFMFVEYGIRRWYLRHIPHAPPRQFVYQLVRNWPQLLRDTDLRAPRNPEAGHEWIENVCIPTTHPSLPGHFPGEPVVAGVILLDRLAALLEREGCGSLRRIPVVKFRSPLLPGEAAELQVALTGKQVRFRVSRRGEVLVSGEAELA